MSAAVQTEPPQNGTGNDAAAKRAAVISELESLGRGTPDNAAGATTEPAPGDGSPQPPDPSPAAPVEEPAPEPVEERPAEKPDPDTEKRLGIVEKQEKRMREQLARDRAEMSASFERDKAVWLDKVRAAESVIEDLKVARRDPIRALKAMGFSEDDYEPVARMIYAHSKAGATNPANRAAAEAALRDREHTTYLERLQAKVEALETSIRERDESAVVQSRLDAYAASVTKAISDETPLIRQLHERNPGKAKQALLEAADRLYARDGEVPDASDVLKEYEAQRRAELEELGIDPALITKAKARSVALPGKPGATVTPANGAATPQAPSNKKPTREEMLAGLERLSE